MSAPVYCIPPKFRALLRERECSVAILAVRCSMPVRRAQWALCHHPKARPEDRRTLAPLLTMAEHVALGWAWNGDLLPVEHSKACGTWEAQRQPRAPLNKCSECAGEGVVMASWSEREGLKTRTCPKCKGARTPNAADQAPPTKDHE